MGNFGDVREALQATDLTKAWERVLHELDPWFGSEPIDVVLEYCQGHLDRWPEELETFAPRSWFKRDADVIAADPLTPLFEHAALGRTGYWKAWAEGLLEGCKALKPPKFLDMEELGEMRWRSGEALTEDQTRRLIVYLRSHEEVGSLDLEHLRQLLDDEDAQRWGSAIHAAWVENGEKSAHRWAFFQLAAFGKHSDLSTTAEELEGMVSSGRSVRAKQLMDIMAAMGAPGGLSAVGRFALQGALRMGSRAHALEVIEPLASARSMNPFEYMERVLDVHDPLSWTPEHWADPSAPESSTRAGSLAQDLEHAMCIQRAFPWWRLRDHAEVLATQPALVWEVDDERAIRFTQEGAIDHEGAAVEIADGSVLRLVHPAAMSAADLARWREVLSSLEAQPPFVQLERPVIEKGADAVLKDGDRMAIHPDAFDQLPWSEGPFSDDYVYSRYLRLMGAPWYAIAEHNYQDSFRDGRYGDEDGCFIESVKIVSVFSHGEHRAGDEVAFSETQLSLREIQRVSAELGVVA